MGVTILGMELSKLKSASSSSLNFEECYHDILGQESLGFAITFINGFVPLRWLPIKANRKFIRAKDTVWKIVRGLVNERFAAVEARQNHGTGVEPREKSESRDVLTYMIEANLTGGEALSREQIVEDVCLIVPTLVREADCE
jgi:cytochrome P450